MALSNIFVGRIPSFEELPYPFWVVNFGRKGVVRFG